MDISGKLLYDKSVTGKVWQLFGQPCSKDLGAGEMEMSGMIKIMMVEDEECVRGEFREALEKFPNMEMVHETGSERDALKYMQENEVRVIILDIELEEGDGVSLLEEIKKAEVAKPFIVVVTNTGSNVTLNYMRENGVDYVYRKMNASYSPKRVLNIIGKIFPYQRFAFLNGSHPLVEYFNEEKTDTLMRKFVEQELVDIGFRRRRSGFVYMVDAILMIMKNKGSALHITNDIYPAIAVAHETTKENVERCIRGAIEATWTETDIRKLERYYPFPYDEEQGRPTNFSFLTNIAARLQL